MSAAERTLALPDGRTLAARVRPGRGTPLVLLHGVLDCAEGWEPVASATARPSVAFDLPGFGGSDPPSRPRVSAYAEDVMAGLEQLGVTSYVLVGHSLGGAVATAVAENAPGAAAALVLIAPAGFGRIPLAEAISVPGVRNVAAALLPLALSNGRALDLAYSTVITRGFPLDEAIRTRTIARARESMGGARDATRAVVAAGLSKRAFHRRAVGFPGPVSAVWGERDLIVPRAHAEGVRRAFPQARIEIWPRVSHHPQAECPERLGAFIERCCAATSAAEAA